MEEYTTEERIEYLGSKIEYLISKEPELLSIVERIINGLCIIDDEVINDMQKITTMTNMRILKDRKHIEIMKDFSHHYTMREFKSNK